MENNIEVSGHIGFDDRELNRQALVRSDNDLNEAITMLTSTPDFDADAIFLNKLPSLPSATAFTYINPPLREQVEQHHLTILSNSNSQTSSDNLPVNNSNEPKSQVARWSRRR